jgi:hypothetical protein
MDSGAFGERSTIVLRKAVSSYPAIRPDTQFWDDEYNSLPTFSPEMSEAIQAKYVPRTVVYNWAAGVATYLWELINDTSTSEGDNFGIIHGMMHRPADFQPRPVFQRLARTNALFGDTVRDASMKMKPADPSSLESHAPFHAYGFRSRRGKAIVAYWLAERIHPKHPMEPVYADMSLTGTGIAQPVLIDVDSDSVSRLAWDGSPDSVLRHIPVKDSVMAIADDRYFDWDVLPEIPAPLKVETRGPAAKLTWPPADAGTRILVEHLANGLKGWSEIQKLSGGVTSYQVNDAARTGNAAFRIRAANAFGRSGYSNIVTVSASKDQGR